MTRARFGWTAFAYALFVAYGSFIPFLYQPLEFDEALRRFAHIQFLLLGALDRADWIANALLYMPFGWFVAGTLSPAPRRAFVPGVLAAATIVGAALAISVEFAQLYFPNRTVSLNDIIAEIIGSMIGALAWVSLATHWHLWWQQLFRGGRITARAVLVGYGVAYLALALAPFDFIISSAELNDKLASNLYGIWSAPVGCGTVPCSMKFALEALLAAPLGWLWVRWRRIDSGGEVSALAVGLSLGLAIEGAQFFLVNGVSEGVAVLMRGVGMALGAALYVRRSRLQAVDLSRVGRPLVLAACLPYLWLIAFVNGWFTRSWLDPAQALARLRELGVEWLPFYFHYYTTELAAIRSALVHSLLYAPTGVAIWLWSRDRARLRIYPAPLIAVLLAATAEMGKLFIAAHHPDFSDVLIGGFAAWVAAWLLRSVSRGEAVVAGPSGATREIRQGADRARSAQVAVRLIGIVLLMLAAWSVLAFPIVRAPLAAGLIVYAVLLARFPQTYLWVVPVALTMLDLAPWSGRTLWDAFDILLLTTAGVRLLIGLQPPQRKLDLPAAGFAVLGVSVVVSAAIGLVPLETFDANALIAYLSPYNALRIAKGYGWGIALAWLVARDAASGKNAGYKLIQGMTLALLALAANVVWERSLFTGLFSLDVNFRVAGPVSAMHIGGAYLDALLVILFPFALLLSLTPAKGYWRVLAGVATVLGAYAVLVTLSRSTIVAWILGVIVFALLWSGRERRVARFHSPRGSAGLPVAAAAVAAVIATGAFLQFNSAMRDRFASVGKDADVRLTHWQHVLGLMNFRPLNLVFGMGLGSFPRESYLERSLQGDRAAIRIEREPPDNRMALVLYGGKSLFAIQRIAAQPGDLIEVDVVAQATRKEARIIIAICEATVLYSARCVRGEIEPDQKRILHHVSLRVHGSGGDLGAARPRVLSIQNGTAEAVRVYSVSARSAGGAEILRNGNFEMGFDHWFFTSDDHLAWHPKNALLYILFELGLLGVVAWAALAVSTCKGLRAEDSGAAPAIGAAMIALLIVTAFDTVIDSPRMILLLIVLAVLPASSIEKRPLARG